MAKNATKANTTIETETKEDAKGVALVAGGTLAIPAGDFDPKLVEKAVAHAMDAWAGADENQRKIDALEGEITLRKEGIGSRLFKLAGQCVKLTMKSNTADLLSAANLMEVACKGAEDIALTKWKKDHNGAETKIRELVPSWPVMKSKMLNAMKKANIDPTTLPMVSSVETAYAQWLEKHPEAADGRGAKARSTDNVAVQVPRAVAETATKLNKLTDGARNALMALTSAVQAKPEALQPRCASLIDILIKQINALTDADAEDAADKAAGVTTTRRPANPARETERPGMAA